MSKTASKLYKKQNFFDKMPEDAKKIPTNWVIVQPLRIKKKGEITNAIGKREREKGNTKDRKEKGKGKGKCQSQKGKGKRKREMPKPKGKRKLDISKSKGKRKGEKEIYNTKGKEKGGKFTSSFQILQGKGIPIDL